MKLEVREVKPATNECANCGHEHAGAEYGWICVGCPCPKFQPKIDVVPAPADGGKAK